MGDPADDNRKTPLRHQESLLRRRLALASLLPPTHTPTVSLLRSSSNTFLHTPFMGP